MKQKMNSLQGVRGIAFLAVFLTHCEVIFNMGGWGVSVFFVLSGFLMAYQYSDRIERQYSVSESIQFGIQRIKKIYPLHILMTIASLPIVIVQMVMKISDISIMKLIALIFLQITLLQTWIPIQDYYFSINGLSWYLSVALFLYVMFPYVLQKQKKKTNRQLVMDSIILYAVIWSIITLSVMIFPDNEGYKVYFSYVFPPLRLCDFAIGCNFGLLFLRDKGNISMQKATFVEGVTIAAITVSVLFLNSNHSGLVANIISHSTGLYLPTSIGLVYIFALNKGLFSKALTNRVLIYIGDISLYGYLIHQRIIAYLIVIFTHALGRPLDVFSRAIITAILTLAAIYTYKHLIIWYSNRKGTLL